MKTIPPDNRQGIAALRLALALCAIAVVPLLVYAGAPSWWSQRGVLIQNATPSDFATANQGQLKNIAKAAAAEMDAQLPGGAGAAVHALIASWSPPNPQTNDRAPVNLGQLKNVAKPFYDRLIATTYASNYPWVTAPNPSNDFAAANIGQVKNLFSFDFRAVDVMHDTDQNSLADWWERFYFGNIGNNPNALAPRGGGVTILQAFQQVLNPNDFYDGVLPLVQKTNGDAQTGRTNEILIQPLRVRITDSGGAPVANAPVTFSGSASGATLAAFPSGPFNGSFTANADQNGIAAASVRLPGTAGAVNIVATVASGSDTQSVTFTATAATPVDQIAPPPYEVRVLPANAPPYIVTFESNSGGLIAGSGTDQPSSEAGSPPRRSFLWDPVSGAYTELGFLPGSNSTEALALNNAGDVVGDATDANGNDQGFLWRNGTIEPLVAPGATYTYPYAINDAGQVVGTTYDANWVSRGFVWDNGVFTLIEVPNSNGTTVEDINAAGQVVGSYYDEDWNSQAFIWQNGVITPISIPGAMSVSQHFLNDSGQVAGVYRGQNYWDYGFFWQNGVAATITLGGFRTSVYGLNATGQVIGSSVPVGKTVDRGFVWQNGQLTQLGSLAEGQWYDYSVAQSINFYGAIVGTSATPQGSSTSVLWQDGRLWKLTGCVPAYLHPDGAYFEISDSSDITGRRLVLHRLPDSDGDGLPDAWETQYGLDPSSAADAAIDTDGDGLTNYQEYQAGTNPLSANTDGDAMPDGWEVAHGYDPRDAADAQLDEDNDGLTTAQEYQNGTEPRGAYIVTDIAASNSVWVFPSSLNAAGQVIGTRGDSAGNTRGFFWHDGVTEDVTPLGAGSIDLYSFNDLGQTVGRYWDGNNVLHVFLWQNGAATDLPLPPLYSSAAFLRPQINNQGQIMATSVDANSRPQSFIWRDGAVVEIASAFAWSYGLGLNNPGLLVGAAFDADWTGHGFIWQDGNLNSLPQVPDRGAINDGGVVAIQYRDPVTQIQRVATVENGLINPLGTGYVGELVLGRAINAAGHILVRNGSNPGVWSDGQLAMVAALDGLWVWPQAFNDSDAVVGESTTPSGATHAFIARKNHTTDLNYLVPQGSGLEFSSAIAINNDGQILVKAYKDGWNHAVLLTPNNDSGSNGLPDDWEKFYFAQTGIDPNGDFDGDGITNAQEYANRTNPNDYYNGQTPSVVVISGNNQVAAPNAFLSAAFVVKVTDSAGNPLANAPVTFVVADGGGALAADRQPPTASSFAMRSAADGTASAFYLEPGEADVVSHITVSAGPIGSPATAVFEAISASGTGVQVNPASISRTLNPGTSVTVPIQITNYTDTPQQLTALVTGIPLPYYTDSRQENGPEFVWNDISNSGTHLDGASNTDDAFEAFDIGFEFPFFGATYHTVYVSANGYVTFGTGSTRFMSRALPSSLMAPNLVAAFATDLNTRATGDIYYQEQTDGVTVQFSNVGYFGSAGASTFQIVLKRDGTILFYYADMGGTLNQATVGVQNGNRDVGLTVVSNAEFLVSNLAVRIDNAQRRQVPTTAPAGTAYNGSYSDSDQTDGPAYVWDDISTTGTRLDYISNVDDGNQPVYISFAFPFYESTYQTVNVSSNGYVTFGNASSGGGHGPLPGWMGPPSIVAALETDLDSSVSGDIYYEERADRLIIQYNNVAFYGGDGLVTFQIVLQSDGGILFYYNDLSGNFAQSTVGMQDSTQTKGLTVANDQPYLKNNLAVRLDQLSRWLTVEPQAGTLPSGSSVTVNALVDARFMVGGTYDSMIHIESTGATELAFDVPVTLRVNTAPDVYLTAPSYWQTFIEDYPVTLAAEAQDSDGIAKVEFFEGTTKLGEATVAPFTISTTGLAPGVRWITARAFDTYGMSRMSDAVAVQIEADSDHDGMNDNWEMNYFGNLDQGANDDADEDGLSNLQECNIGTDPTIADSDGDDLSDGDEVNLYGTNPLSYDSDYDGLSDGDEVNVHHTNPLVFDTDGDSLPDAYEVSHGLDPLRDDTQEDLDGDGLTNLQEFILETDPNNQDSDGDGANDGADSDGDGLPDVWEQRYFGSPVAAEAGQDSDSDGLTNMQEYQSATDPTRMDTDGDLLSDAWELQYQLNPRNAAGEDGRDGDPDHDGLSNLQEVMHHSSPRLGDSDGDGADDGTEAAQGSFPNDPNDGGNPPTPEEELTVKIIVGDPSGSHSERWSVKVKDLTSQQTILEHQSASFGELSADAQSTFKQFRRGHAYELQLVHIGTDPAKLASNPNFYPDYDWALEVSVQNQEGVFETVTGKNAANFLALDPWDPQTSQVSETVKLLVNRTALQFPWEGQPDRTQQYQNQIAAKRVILLPVEVQVFEKAKGSAPLDGLIVEKGNALVCKANNLPAGSAPVLLNQPVWYYQQMQANGWPADDQGWQEFGEKKAEFDYTPAAGGIFRIKAVFSGNRTFKLVRARDDQYSRSNGNAVVTIKKGDPDAIGVVDTPIQIAIRNSAQRCLGNTDYAVDTENPPMPNPSNKCNLFVAHKAQDAGAAVPWFNGYPWPLTSYPPVANQWAGTETTPEGGTSITGWTLLPADALPQPGTIVAHPDPFDSGHVGVIDYDGRAVAAGTYTVNRAYPFFDGTSRQRKYNQ